MRPDPLPVTLSAHARRRRTLATALAALPACWLPAWAQPAAPRLPTPAQTEGPFYPLEIPRDADHDLLQNGALSYPEGLPAWLEGSVSDLAGRPLAGAQVEIWQCDHAGHYHHPGDGGRADARFQGFGRVTVGADGRYRFRTIRPAPYSGRTPHIHLKVRLRGRELLTTQVYVAGDPGNPRDFLWRSLTPAERAALTVPFVPGSDGLRAEFAIVIAA
ncbi:protocatechuate 3,4-dioxygenase [Azospira restricta]|uniref:Intradiol ring-cleavage dioxygenase n=1 Tax=Azospira restricta TaxID=404405 RepID=A0A974Y302_9RHOO|nr:protocatechuate 3,4-dioxygenase [Azospira restricta]QRJ63648.1 intradiol ring-cleavage dioxygenase [Azospira restricta]